MNKPRFAIEVIDVVTQELAYTHYFDISNDGEIITKIDEIRRSTRFKINRFYYANNYGIEINFEEV